MTGEKFLKDLTKFASEHVQRTLTDTDGDSSNGHFPDGLYWKLGFAFGAAFLAIMALYFRYRNKKETVPHVETPLLSASDVHTGEHDLQPVDVENPRVSGDQDTSSYQSLNP